MGNAYHNLIVRSKRRQRVHLVGMPSAGKRRWPRGLASRGVGTGVVDEEVCDGC